VLTHRGFMLKQPIWALTDCSWNSQNFFFKTTITSAKNISTHINRNFSNLLIQTSSCSSSLMPVHPELSELIRRLEESTLAEVTPALHQLRNEYFKWLLISTGVVAIGVLMEGPEVISDLRDEIIRWRRGYIPAEFDPRTRMPRCEGVSWKKLLASLGWLLIVVGVCAEGAFEALVAKEDNAIQSLDSRHIEKLDLEVIEAESESRQASDSASKSNVEAARALNGAVIATDKAVSAQIEAGRNKQEAARLNKAAEDEAAKRIALEEQLAWRKLTADQEAKLSAPIPVHFIGTPLAVASISGDPEGVSYASAIWRCLVKAGWNVGSGPNADMLTGTLPQGLLLRIEARRTDADKAGGFLQTIFKSGGLGEVPGVVAEEQMGLAAPRTGPRPELELIVGVKGQPTIAP
jgi:hypothetical protein